MYSKDPKSLMGSGGVSVICHHVVIRIERSGSVWWLETEGSLPWSQVL